MYNPSTVTGHKHNPDIRISETAWVDDPRVMKKLLERIGIHPHKTIGHCEKLQVVRYKPGGFYKPHNDTIRDPSKGDRYFKKGGHRVYTLLIALTDKTEYDGGETVFPKANTSYKLNKGDALLFRNIDKHGTLINVHGGHPVRSGTKIIMNLWIHEHSIH
jgi:prolyl 4-hydroxylase